MPRLARTFGTLLALALLSSAAQGAEKSLYARIGGRKKIAAAVSRFVTKVEGDALLMSDPALRAAYQKLDKRLLKKQLTDRVCQLTGGPCQFHGFSQTSLVHGIRLKPSQMLAVIQDLGDALDQAHVPQSVQGELVGLLMSSH